LFNEWHKSSFDVGLSTRVYFKVTRPRDSEGTVIRSSSQAATCYNHSKVEAIPLSVLSSINHEYLFTAYPRGYIKRIQH